MWQTESLKDVTGHHMVSWVKNPICSFPLVKQLVEEREGERGVGGLQKAN